jgi:hypothetical protein
VTDVNGQATQSSEDLTVVAGSAPALTLLPFVELNLNSNGLLELAVDNVLVSSVHACGVVSTVISTVTEFDATMLVATTDVNGNVATCT